MENFKTYLATVDSDKVEAVQYLYEIIKDNLPKGFEESFNYNMPGFVVPLDKYPKGYLNRKEEPLPFINVASQKNYIALYHMGLVADKELRTWFENEYRKQVPTKLNMGKSCIRFTKVENIPYELIKELVRKMDVDTWIKLYEKAKG